MHKNKFTNILGLSSQERYGYLIRQAADFEEVWLIKDGVEFVTLADDIGQECVPVLPEQEFAEYLLIDNWQNCLVERIGLDEFFLLLNHWQEQLVGVAGFPGADLKSVVVKAEEIKNHLLHEVQQYE